MLYVGIIRSFISYMYKCGQADSHIDGFVQKKKVAGRSLLYKEAVVVPLLISMSLIEISQTLL